MALTTALTGIVGEQIVVRSQAADTNGLASTSTVTWASSNTAIATVQNTLDIVGGALIVCIAAGTATVTATAAAVTATFTVTVVAAGAGVATTLDVVADYHNQPQKS